MTRLRNDRLRFIRSKTSKGICIPTLMDFWRILIPRQTSDNLKSIMGGLLCHAVSGAISESITIIKIIQIVKPSIRLTPHARLEFSCGVFEKKNFE